MVGATSYKHLAPTEPGRRSHHMAPATEYRTRKIRLTFLVRSLDFGGAQRQLVTLAKALDKTQFDVSVLTFYSGQPLEQELKNSGVRIISLDKRGRWDLFPFLRRLLREAKLLHPDILHGYLDIPNLLALLLKPFIHARVVWGVRAADMELRHYDWLRRLAARLERFLSRFPDLIIVNSVAALKYHIARSFPASRLMMIPNGIDTEVFRPDLSARVRMRSEWNIAEDTRLIGTVGRIDPVKDLPIFLQAAAIVCGQMTDARFICVGTGRAEYVQELKTLAADLDLADRVIWAEARLDTPGIYSAIDLLVSSSRSESFPNAVAEAMSCGVPCIVTDVGDSALLVGEGGMVVPPRDAESLAAGIIRSLAAIDTGADNNGRARIIEHFSARQLAKRTADVLATLGQTS
ncbi:MAG: glycosyl transferase group 1 [Acidobacteria bacterium]|nr:glycosyl transferase group 1 [Acidobacteriota bacterium]